ncbi:MAG: restriction endonuclease [Planctomycetota bacterium]
MFKKVHREFGGPKRPRPVAVERELEEEDAVTSEEDHQGRADKGIILTTSTFTSDARKEAMRDGVPPIELVDGEKLIEMFEKLEFGLVPRTAYDLDEAFFAQFDIDPGTVSKGDGRASIVE